MKGKFARGIIVLIVIINLGLVYWNIKVTKEIRTLREESHLLIVWSGKATESIGYALAHIQIMNNDLEELKKKAKTFY